MPNFHIVLNVRGGLVQDVFCSDPHARVILVDWDTEGCEPGQDGVVECLTDSGRWRLARVSEYSPDPIGDVNGTDVELALRAAEVNYGPT